MKNNTLDENSQTNIFLKPFVKNVGDDKDKALKFVKQMKYLENQ